MENPFIFMAILLIAATLLFLKTQSADSEMSRDGHRSIKGGIKANAFKVAREYIQAYRFPAHLENRLTDRFPNLRAAEVREVFICLREFLTACALRRQVYMPSKAVDFLWHEFILSTAAYQAFCNEAYGCFLHHTPAGSSELVGRDQEMIASTLRLWREHFGLSKDAVPEIFTLDERLKIEGGLRYRMKDQAGNSAPEARGLAASSGSCATPMTDVVIVDSALSSGCSSQDTGGDAGGDGGGSSCGSSCGGGGD